MWLLIWNFIKNPKNIIITVLAVALVSLVLFSLTLYVGKGVADVKLKKALQEIDAKDQLITNQELRLREFTENLKQIRLSQDKLARIKISGQQIQQDIKEASSEKALVDARNDIIDLLYNGLRDQPAVKAE